jgi:hypothetical protein
MVLFQLDKPSHVDSNQSEDTKKGLPESCSFKPLQYFITPGGDEEVSLTESRLSGENGQGKRVHPLEVRDIQAHDVQMHRLVYNRALHL